VNCLSGWLVMEGRVSSRLCLRPLVAYTFLAAWLDLSQTDGFQREYFRRVRDWAAGGCAAWHGRRTTVRLQCLGNFLGAGVPGIVYSEFGEGMARGLAA